MKIILSPAKSINFEINIQKNETTLPQFLSESEYLVNKLKKLSARQISKLMSVSAEIADLNVNRFNNWHLPFTNDNSKPAADIFTGAAYQGLDFPSMSAEDRAYGQENLRILSGLYGVLKPLDIIQPYRLEMGTSFKVTPKVRNLYLFWGDKIVSSLSQELELDEILVNLASSEYFKAAKLAKLQKKVVTPIFKDITKTSDYKVIMTFAKKARGLMTRYILENRIDTIAGIKAFDIDGYYFYPQESNDEELVFRRG